MKEARRSSRAFDATSILMLGLAVVSAHADDRPAASSRSPVGVVAVDTNALPTYDYDAGKIRFIASSEQTGGRSAVVELTEMPGYRTAWHRHDACDEAFYVLEGKLTIRIVDRTYRFPPGSYVFIPRGTPHAQGNLTAEPVKLLTTFTPGGFDAFFKDRVDLYDRTKPDDPAFRGQFDQLRARHAKWVQVLGTWDPGGPDSD